MRIRVLRTIRGPHVILDPGEREVEDNLALALIEAGGAEFLEVATVEPPENAARVTKRPRKRTHVSRS